MIVVPFVFDKHEIEDSGPIVCLHKIHTQMQFPWLEFLFEHVENIEYSKNYSYETMLYNVKFRFYLPPEIETMYHLKYN